MAPLEGNSLCAVDAFVEQFAVAVDFQEHVTVAASTALADLPEWDSLAALGVIVMCDTEYGVAITGEDLKACKTVADIFARVEAKKSK
jgi:acyl carrier protein